MNTWITQLKSTANAEFFPNGFHPKQIDRDQYEKDLAERQKNHLEGISSKGNQNWRPCMHDQCSKCHGTGRSIHGSCIHMISCPCPKCSPTY